MTRLWVKFRSWHVFKEQRGTRYRTRCGLMSESIPRDTYPAQDKTCETCLRIITWEDERGT